MSGFLIPWDEIEPRGDIAWLFASRAARGRFHREAARLASAVYTDEREQGIDRFGRKLLPLKPRTIKYRRSAMGVADRNAPPLIPAHELSRSSSYLRVRVRDDGLWCTWAYKWGTILTYHALGLVRGAPARDIIGLSPAGVARLRTLAARAWKGERVTVARRVAERAQIEPGVIKLPVAKPIPTRPSLPSPKPAARYGWQTREVSHVESATGGQSGFGDFAFSQKRILPKPPQSRGRSAPSASPPRPKAPRVTVPATVPGRRPAARRKTG